MNKTFLATFVALFALFAVMSFVSASVDLGDLTSAFDVTVDGIEYSSYDPIGIEAGETIPIKVIFTAGINAENAKVKVWIDGYRIDIKDETGRFELVDGSTYSKKFSLIVPSDIDPTEEYTLRVRLTGENEDGQKLDDEDEFALILQRDSYELEVLGVEVPGTVTPGSTIALDIVLKNRGMRTLEDVFVKASISDLGIQKITYFGDIDEQDTCESGTSDCDDDKEDATERRVYLTIPSNAKSGVYNLEVEAYNADSSTTVKRSVVISGEGLSEILSGSNAKSIGIGETAIYDLVLVNSGNTVKVYNLVPKDAKGLIVTVDPVVTVSPGSSTTAKVSVKATESAEEGTQTVTIDVNSEGQLVKQVSYSANVEKGAARAASSVVVLTIVLAIVFIVLLIVLIVLLTKKPATVETEETSYY